MSQEMKVKDLWIHQPLCQECSCPLSCLDLLPLCQLLFLSPPSQGYKAESLDQQRSGVRIYLHYTSYHSTEPMEPQIRLGVPAAPGEMVSVVTQLLPLLSTRNDPHAVCQSAGSTYASEQARLHICWHIKRRAHTVLQDLMNMIFLILNFLHPPLETCRAKELCKVAGSNRSPLPINIKTEKYSL